MRERGRKPGFTEGELEEDLSTARVPLSVLRESDEVRELFQEGYLANEFVGLPVAEELMRQFDVEIQSMLEGNQTAAEAAAKAQANWAKEF